MTPPLWPIIERIAMAVLIIIFAGAGAIFAVDQRAAERA